MPWDAKASVVVTHIYRQVLLILLFILFFHSFHQSAELFQTNTCICWTFPIIYLQGPLFKQNTKAWTIELTHLRAWVSIAFSLLQTVIFKDHSCFCQVVECGLGFFHSVFQSPCKGKYPVESCFWSHLGCWICTMHIWNSWFRPFSFSSCCFWQGKKCSKVREFVPV